MVSYITSVFGYGGVPSPTKEDEEYEKKLKEDCNTERRELLHFEPRTPTTEDLETQFINLLGKFKQVYEASQNVPHSRRYLDSQYRLLEEFALRHPEFKERLSLLNYEMQPIHLNNSRSRSRCIIA